MLPWAVFVFLFVAFTLQWFPWGWAQASDFESLGILAPGMALAIVFLSFVVVTGLGGMVSLAQGTFVTAGGFVAGWAVNHDFGIDVPVRRQPRTHQLRRGRDAWVRSPRARSAH